MATQTPLIFVDNAFDTVTLYPLATLSAISYVTGREPFRAVDGRRDRSWWQPTNDGGAALGNWIRSDLGVGNTIAPNYLFLDRGHNLWGKTIVAEASNDPTFATGVTTYTWAVPASGTVGGDPTTGIAATEEGALYTLFGTALPASRAVQFRVPQVASFVPVITGVMLGVRNQLLNYASQRDEDAKRRTDVTEESQALYRGTAKRYSGRTLNLPVSYVGATEYDGALRTLLYRLFDLDQPYVCAIEYGTYPARAWMYQYDGTMISTPMSRVYRGITITGREVGPLLR